MQVIDWTDVGFEQAFILSPVGIAEVVGSNPTRSIFINLVEYGIELSLIWEVVDKRSDRCLSCEFDCKALRDINPFHQSSIY